MKEVGCIPQEKNMEPDPTVFCASVYSVSDSGYHSLKMIEITLMTQCKGRGGDKGAQ